MEEVRLYYKRVQNDRSLGHIEYLNGDEKKVLHSFDAITWVPMLSKFAKELQAYPQAAGVIQRTDREGLRGMRLNEAELMLFRTDPAAAIRSMTYLPLSVKMRTGEEQVNVMQPFPASIDSLVETFGTVLYLRLYRDLEDYFVECPVRATWEPLRGTHIRLLGNLELELSLDYKDHGWAGVSARTLLDKRFPQYFLPRQWNKTGAWISWEDLHGMLTSFEKERESA